MRFMKYSNAVPFFVVLFFSLSVEARLKSLTISYDEKLKVYTDERDLKKSSFKKYRSLIRTNLYRQKGQFQKCLKEAKKASRSNRMLLAWIAEAELFCAVRGHFRRKVSSYQLRVVINRIEKQTQWLVSGAVAEKLKQGIVTGRTSLLERYLQTEPSRAVAAVERLLSYLEWMSVDQRAKAFRLAGEVAFIQQRLSSARSYVLRSLEEQEDVGLRNKLKSIEAALKPADKQKEESLATSKLVPIVKENLEATQKELELTDRMREALRAGEVISAVEDGIQIIRAYPAGVRAQWASRQIINVYLEIAAKDDPKYKLLRQSMLDQMSLVSSDLLLEWAKAAFRRLNYVDSLRLAETAASKTEGAEGIGSLNLAAVSAYYLGDFSKANRYFVRVNEKSGGRESSLKALFWMAMVAIRKNDFQMAISQLERLLVLPGNYDFQLKARYWLWRCLQKTKGEQAKEHAKILAKEFPMSYYGLRAKAELAGNVLKPIKEQKRAKIKLWLTDAEMKSWFRFETLVASGWFPQAQEELDRLPQPVTVEGFLVFARLWGVADNYRRATYLTWRAWDEGPGLIDKTILQNVFPVHFSAALKTQSQKRKMDTTWLLALIRQESSFYRRAISPAGAKGLMQLMPATAAEVAKELNMSISDKQDLFDPEINISLGSRYFEKMLTINAGNLGVALACYNAGPTRTRKWIRRRNLKLKPSNDPFSDLWIEELPWSETSLYVKRVYRNILVYKWLDSGRVELSNPWWMRAPVDAK
jgi:soluble lytic murein transglycosylase